MQWFEFAFIDSFFMLKAKEIHKIFNGLIILNEITVSVSDIHSVTHSTDVKTLYQCCCVSKCRQCLKLYLILFLASMPWMIKMEFISSVHAAQCGVTCSRLYLIVEDGHCLSIIVMCSILSICNRVHHNMSGMLSYKHDAVTWITDYLQVTRIFRNERFANIIRGLTYFVFQFNFIINNNSQKYIVMALKLSLDNYWM